MAYSFAFTMAPLSCDHTQWNHCKRFFFSVCCLSHCKCKDVTIKFLGS